MKEKHSHTSDVSPNNRGTQMSIPSKFRHQGVLLFENDSGSKLQVEVCPWQALGHWAARLSSGYWQPTCKSLCEAQGREKEAGGLWLKSGGAKGVLADWGGGGREGYGRGAREAALKARSGKTEDELVIMDNNS